MKKLLGIAALFAVMLLLSSCGGGNTPKDVAGEAVEALKNQNYEKFADLLYYNLDEGENIKDKKEQAAVLLKEKLGKAYEKEGGIKSYEILSEEIDEKGEKAIVTMKIEYGNDTVKDKSKMSLKKDKDGKWKVDLGK